MEDYEGGSRSRRARLTSSVMTCFNEGASNNDLFKRNQEIMH
jgi:hypothetical protein